MSLSFLSTSAEFVLRLECDYASKGLDEEDVGPMQFSIPSIQANRKTISSLVFQDSEEGTAITATDWWGNTTQVV